LQSRTLIRGESDFLTEHFDIMTHPGRGFSFAPIADDCDRKVAVKAPPTAEGNMNVGGVRGS
jgi:hypothetical protein